jgi:hypothetical protein
MDQIAKEKYWAYVLRAGSVAGLLAMAMLLIFFALFHDRSKLKREMENARDEVIGERDSFVDQVKKESEKIEKEKDALLGLINKSRRQINAKRDEVLNRYKDIETVLAYLTGLKEDIEDAVGEEEKGRVILMNRPTWLSLADVARLKGREIVLTFSSFNVSSEEATFAIVGSGAGKIESISVKAGATGTFFNRYHLKHLDYFLKTIPGVQHKGKQPSQTMNVEPKVCISIWEE